MSPSTITAGSAMRGSSSTRPTPARSALVAVLRYYRGLGIRFKRVLIDNGACYPFSNLCEGLPAAGHQTLPYQDAITHVPMAWQSA